MLDPNISIPEPTRNKGCRLTVGFTRRFSVTQQTLSRNSLKARRRIPWFCRILLVGLIGLSTPVLGQNVSVTDYKVPVSRADNLRIDGLNFNYTTSDDQVLVEKGDAGVVYRKFYSSLPFAYFIDFIGSASYNRQPDGNRVGFFDTQFSLRLQKYIQETGKFFYALRPDVVWEKDFDRPQTDITISLGYGRFINATALRKAVRIEDFLLKEGIISDYLPKENMIRLGQTIEKQDEYKDLYGDRSYQNYWYEDMSNEINKSGLVLGSQGNIGPIGILRMREVLTLERINDRFFGWDANVGVQFQLLTAEKNQKRRDPAMAINLRYSRPLSWSTQINTNLKINSPFSTGFARDYTLTQEIDIIYEITNRISISTLNTIRVRKDRNQDARLSLISSNNFTFFVENQISLTIGEQISKAKGLPFRQSFNFTLNYRIF